MKGNAVFVAFVCAVVIASIGGVTADPLPNNNGIYFNVANTNGVAHDVTGNNTYYVIKAGNGLNPIQLSNDPTNKVGIKNTTTNQYGNFWVVFSGGIGHLDDAILMLAVNGSIPDNFSVHIESNGYSYTPSSVGYSNPPNPAWSNVTNISTRINETFYKSDFIYGPQNWKPANTANYPIFYGENTSDPGQNFSIMFIDLNTSAFVTGAYPYELNDGSINVTYSFNNLPSTSLAAFNVYGWFSACNWGPGIPQTNNIAQSGFNVIGTS
jgi:hypothetical protein